MRNEDTVDNNSSLNQRPRDWDPLDLEKKGAAISFLGPGILKVLDALPFYVLLIDKNHRILLANEATRSQLSLEPEEILGEFCPKVVHGIDEGSYPGCPLEEAVQTGKPVEKEHFDEDTGRWSRIAMYPTGTWTVDGEEIFFHMIQDVTEYKTQMAELQARLDEEIEKNRS